MLAIGSAGLQRYQRGPRGYIASAEWPGWHPDAGQPATVPAARARDDHPRRVAPSGQSTSTAIVSASFVPDASQVTSCTTTLAGCTLATPAICNGATGPLCQEGQTCVLDPSCKPTCQATCSVQCPTGQECYFSTSSTQSCRATQTFDGGDLVFSGAGLASAITLFPPVYTFGNPSGGNPIVPGGQIQITASGSTGAGFAAFQETFKATTLLQTIPSLSKLTAARFQPAVGLALGWQPGGDAIAISVTGPKGTAECAAIDAAGTFTVPSAVISAVAGTGSPAITVSVTRQRVEEKTDGKTQGTLLAETVQPVGYLDLTTVSTRVVHDRRVRRRDERDALHRRLRQPLHLEHRLRQLRSFVRHRLLLGRRLLRDDPVVHEPPHVVQRRVRQPPHLDDELRRLRLRLPERRGVRERHLLDEARRAVPLHELRRTAARTSRPRAPTAARAATRATAGPARRRLLAPTTTCSSCESSAESGTCASYYSACADDANCQNYSSCMAGCGTGDTSCESTCELDYPTGA